jgi:regulatory protein spx
VELDERDYARQRLTLDELRTLFADADPRACLNPKSPTFKAMGLRGRTLTADEALRLMAEEPNLLKRPLVIAGRSLVAGFDRDRLREVLK